ncbi:hypothetical protein [Mycolicibacterium cosmeticum]|uniref:hypothetical protein n=1 Tax=Mycolicibacterium cosmeticum TaxID=258533 RepID=UPI003204CC9A
MTEFNRPGSFWEQPGWWVNSGEDGSISRKQLIARWRDAVDLGELDKGAFDDELAIWSSALGQRDWVRKVYGPTAAMYAWKNVDSKQGDEQAWVGVSRLWHDYGEELARYNLRLVAMAHARRPVVTGLLVEEIREPSRKAIRQKSVRKVIVTDARLQSADATRAFLDDPSGFIEGDVEAVMHSYIHRLYEFAQRGNDPHIAKAVSEAIDKLIDEFGEPPPEPGRDLSEAARLKARELLELELEKKPYLFANHKDDDVIGLATAKAIEFLARRIDRNEKVEHAGIIHLTINQVITDQGRREGRERRRFTSLNAILDDPGRPEPMNFGDSERESRTEREVDVRIIIEKVRAEVAKTIYPRLNVDGSVTPVNDFWEKDAALAILRGSTPLDFEGPDTEILGLFDGEWNTRSPERAVSFDAEQAAAYIHSMIVAAFEKVAKVEDLPEVFLFRPGAKRKPNKAAIAKRLLKDAKRNAKSVAPTNEKGK